MSALEAKVSSGLHSQKTSEPSNSSSSLSKTSSGPDSTSRISPSTSVMSASSPRTDLHSLVVGWSAKSTTDAVTRTLRQAGYTPIGLEHPEFSVAPQKSELTWAQFTQWCKQLQTELDAKGPYAKVDTLVFALEMAATDGVLGDTQASRDEAQKNTLNKAYSFIVMCKIAMNMGLIKTGGNFNLLLVDAEGRAIDAPLPIQNLMRSAVEYAAGDLGAQKQQVRLNAISTNAFDGNAAAALTERMARTSTQTAEFIDLRKPSQSIAAKGNAAETQSYLSQIGTTDRPVKAVITGVRDNDSLATAQVRALVEKFGSNVEILLTHRSMDAASSKGPQALAAEINKQLGKDVVKTMQVDAGDAQQIYVAAQKIQMQMQMGHVDFFLHSVNFVHNQQLGHADEFVDPLNKTHFDLSNDISAVSLEAWVHALSDRNLLDQNSGVYSLSYEGGVGVVDGYRPIGRVKALLTDEAELLNQDPRVKAPVNIVYPGATPTTASRAIPDFDEMIAFEDARAPLKGQTLTTKNTADAMMSNWLSGAGHTLEPIWVDHGAHTTLVPNISEITAAAKPKTLGVHGSVFESEYIRVEAKGDHLSLELLAPHGGMKTFDRAAIEQLNQALTEIEKLKAENKLPGIQGLIVNFAGVGANVSEFPVMFSELGLEEKVEKTHTILSRLQQGMPVVSILLPGHVLGGCLEATLSTDWVIAAKDGVNIQFPENPNFSIFPGYQGLGRMVRKCADVGGAFTAAVTGEALTAEKAKKMGVVDQVVNDADQLETTALAKLKELNAKPAELAKLRMKFAENGKATLFPEASLLDSFIASTEKLNADLAAKNANEKDPRKQKSTQVIIDANKAFVADAKALRVKAEAEVAAGNHENVSAALVALTQDLDNPPECKATNKAPTMALYAFLATAKLSLADASKYEAFYFSRCAESPLAAVRIAGFVNSKMVLPPAKIEFAQVQANWAAQAGEAPQSIAVLGASGTMAADFLQVTLPGVQNMVMVATGQGDSAQARAEKNVQKTLELTAKLSKGKLAQTDLQKKVVTTTDISHVKDCPLIIECVAENLDAKVAWLTAAHKQNPDAILATNTSTIMLELIAERLPESARAKLVGIHGFHPMGIMSAIEIVRGTETSDAAVAMAAQYVESLGKTAIIVKSTAGFLINRVLTPLLAQALKLIDQGVSPLEIDAAMKMMGWPMGPAELMDFIGLSTCKAVVNSVAERGMGDRVEAVAEDSILAQLVKVGAKSIYQQDRAGRSTGELSDAFNQVTQDRSAILMSRHEIKEKLELAFALEAIRAMEDDVLWQDDYRFDADGVLPKAENSRKHQAELIDAALYLGLNAPGGAFRFLDNLISDKYGSVENLVARCNELAQTDPAFKVPQTLQQMAAGNERFLQPKP